MQIGQRKYRAYLYTATLLFGVTVLVSINSPEQATGIIASFGGSALAIITTFVYGNKKEHEAKPASTGSA